MRSTIGVIEMHVTNYTVECKACDVVHYVKCKQLVITMVAKHAQNGCRKMVATPDVQPEGMQWVA
jgi:hypothetical protein